MEFISDTRFQEKHLRHRNMRTNPFSNRHTLFALSALLGYSIEKGQKRSEEGKQPGRKYSIILI